MKRVVIVGIPGSGKTTFSQELAKRTGLPLVNLDYYFHQTDKSYYEDKERWVKFVETLVDEPKWILEGNFPRVFEVRARAADTIIFLDFNRIISIWGVLKRLFEHRGGKSRFGMPEDWVEKPNWEFLKYVWQFPKSQKYKDMKKLFSDLNEDKSNSKQMLQFTNRRQLYNWFEGIK